MWAGSPHARGARIKGNSGEKKQENNRQQAVLALARLLNCNYTHGDALLTLTFIDEALERCGGTFEGAVKEAKNFLDRIARRMKKHGDILKWVLVPSEVDGETGETVRLHCHIVINSAGLRMEDRTFTLYGEPLDDTWGRGTVDVQLLRDQKDYYPLALYLIRQARNIPDGKKYTSSRNMEKPKVEYTYVLTRLSFAYRRALPRCRAHDTSRSWASISCATYPERKTRRGRSAGERRWPWPAPERRARRRKHEKAPRGAGKPQHAGLYPLHLPDL